VIRRYGAEDAAACADLYNRVLEVVPTFVPVDAPSLDHAVTEPDSFHDEVAEGTALVAADTGGVRGL
jgi:hypothetical protein